MEEEKEGREENTDPPATPSSGGDDSNGGGNGSSSHGGNDSNTNTDGKVSGSSSSTAPSLAAPIRTTAPNGPHKRARGRGVDGVGVVDAGANDIGVARRGGVGGVVVDDAVKRNKLSSSATGNTTAASEWRPRVCNQVWRGGTCNNRSKGCRFAHPSPCNSSSCTNTPAPNCRAFHPRRKKEGNGEGDVRKGNAAPKRKGSNDHSRPSGSSVGGNNNRNRRSSKGSSSGSRKGNASSLPQLHSRMATMERHLVGMRDGREAPSYRDVVARGLPISAGSGSSSGNNHNSQRHEGVGFGLAQPSPDVLSAVVAAVMAVLAGKGPHF